MNSLKAGFVVQCRVLTALMLREIHTINGNSKLGYLWVLIQSVFSVAVFWGVRLLMGASAPHGISMPLFLVIGFGIWGIFSNIVKRCLTAVEGNRALLTFPQVTVFDVMLSRMIVVVATEFVSGGVIVGMSVMFGYSIEVSSITLFLYVLMVFPLLSLGIGMTVSALAVYLPMLSKIIPMILHLLFFISGVFFGVSAFSHRVADLLLWNPVFQAIELMRESLHVAYRIDGLNPYYLGVCTLVLLVLGGFLERFTRARRMSE